MRDALRQSWFSGLAVVLASWGGFFTLLWRDIFYWTKEGITAGWIGVWADWSVHVTYASVFAFRPWSMWLSSHPLFVGKKFTYPFLADAISGWLMGAGWDIVSAFIVPTILTTLLLLGVMYAFFWLFWKSATRAVLGVTIFLTSGGLGFLWFFADLWESPTWQTLLHPPREYTHIGDITLEWINVVSGQLVPQRALLLGMVVALSVYLFLWSKRKAATVSVPAIIGLGVVSSALLFVHVHSFIVLVVTCAVWFAMEPRRWKFWVPFAVAAGVMSVPIFWWLYGGEVGGSFFTWMPGWLANPRAKGENWFWFWLLNWGLFLPLAAIGTVWGKLWKNPFVVAGWLTFGLTNLILFQPYDWDNSKILTWTYLFLTIAVVEALSRTWSARRILGPAGAIIVFMVITSSGWLDLWRITGTEKNSHLMWSVADLQLAAHFRQISEPGDVVLTADKHNHWVPALTGRQILLGYRGWMWTYGIDYRQRETDMFAMFAGEENARELLEQYSIDYVVIGLPEIHDFKANEDYFRQQFGDPVLSNASYRVYAVHN
ncbi:hypothetical protein LRY65_02435 [Candidatus Woesebacteria bacterium]|nr:hypothetical protein [Candidatus Woesebacteria bacterium]MCD8527051.1 hypothetical protein [Candidatus Woesebacteria bacterium]MCD8545947.1 hypothetical protein [Candidatus Woesebacteria bacterium]